MANHGNQLIFILRGFGKAFRHVVDHFVEVGNLAFPRYGWIQLFTASQTASIVHQDSETVCGAARKIGPQQPNEHKVKCTTNKYNQKQTAESSFLLLNQSVVISL